MRPKEMPISTFSVLFTRRDNDDELDGSDSFEGDFTGARRRMKKSSAQLATMLSPAKYENPLLQYAFAAAGPEDLVKYHHAEEEDEQDEQQETNLAPGDASESADDLEEAEAVESPPPSMTLPQEPFEFTKKSAWGRPRGRKTIQDKIAEQERRAAEIERELRSVGLPSASSGPAPGDKPSPSLHKLGKPGVRRTVPVSVIRKSPAVPSPDEQSTSSSATLSDLGTAYANLARNGFCVSEKASSPAPQQQHRLHHQHHQPAPQLLHFSPRTGLMYMPGVFFRLDQPICTIPGMRLDTSGLHSPSPSPPIATSYSVSQTLQNRDSADLSNLQRPLREERLSTKLKRIKAVAGGSGDESPRGFLSQKIETLKRRESCLQQEFDEVINQPITRTGISSAQDLQNRVATAALIDQRLREPALIQMLRNTAEWKRMRYA